MNYRGVTQGFFLERPNRFIARVLVDGVQETVHVKNTGRCRELLRPGVKVVLERSGHPGRKTAYSLVAVYKGELLINIDSQAPNQVVHEALAQGRLPEFGVINRIVSEVTYGQSRLDLYYQNHQGEGFIEVKGVTLEQDGLALFPDAPTERGVKHLHELMHAVQAGYEGCVFFLIQMRGPSQFQPNATMDPRFSAALRQAYIGGVRVLAYDSQVSKAGITLGSPVTVLI